MTAHIPGGRMKVSTARARWQEVWDAARDGTDPERILNAVSRFHGIADTMFWAWERAPGPYCEGDE